MKWDEKCTVVFMRDWNYRESVRIAINTSSRSLWRNGMWHVNVRYVKEWRYSFNEIRVPVNILNRINKRRRDNASVLKQSKTNKSMNWEDFTYLRHSKSNLRSAVSSLTIYGIQSCSIKALSLAGIDSLLMYFGRYCI